MSLEYTSVDLVPAVVAGVRKVFLTGKTHDISWRKRQLRSLYSLVKDNEDRLYEALSKDMRKPKTEALSGDIAPALEECLYFLENLDHLVKDEKVKPRLSFNALDTLIIRRDPLGVVLIISPWNYPVQLAFVPLAGAIATGNVAVLKLSELCPFTSALMTELFLNYMDSSCYRIVNGDEKVATELLKQPFDHIFYTGNASTARIVMKAASEHLTPVTLELGGKSPALITTSVDMQTVVNRIVFGKFFNCGQICMAVDYVLCPESLVDEIVQMICSTIKQRFGEDPQKSKDYARIISAKHLDRVENLIKNCHKGDIILGGQVDKNDRYCAPTVITNITMDDQIMKEEIFGPILPIIAYGDLEAAIEMINKTPNPLAMYIFSKDDKQVEKVLRYTRSGGVCVNDCFMHQADYALPFGGVGDSGMGNYHSKHSFRALTHERSILKGSQRLESVAKVRYPPYGPQQFKIMRALLVTHPAVKWLKLHSFQCKLAVSFCAIALTFLWQRAYAPVDPNMFHQLKKKFADAVFSKAAC